MFLFGLPRAPTKGDNCTQRQYTPTLIIMFLICFSTTSSYCALIIRTEHQIELLSPVPQLKARYTSCMTQEAISCIILSLNLLLQVYSYVVNRTNVTSRMTILKPLYSFISKSGNKQSQITKV